MFSIEEAEYVPLHFKLYPVTSAYYLDTWLDKYCKAPSDQWEIIVLAPNDTMEFYLVLSLQCFTGEDIIASSHRMKTKP
jgi:hypothetical protein